MECESSGYKTREAALVSALDSRRRWIRLSSTRYLVETMREEGKNIIAKPREGCGLGLLFLGKILRWIGDLELAFQNALEGCGTEEVTTT